MGDQALVVAPPGTRPVTDADAMDLIALIGGIYAEYVGCVLDLEGIDDDLIAPATEVQRRGSPWWVVEAPTGSITATVGAGPLRDGTVELKRLYVAPEQRGRGVATKLVQCVEEHARLVSATAVELWSDTRFHDAHRLYERLGYERTGEARELHDPSATTEWRFTRTLEPAPPRAPSP